MIGVKVMEITQKQADVLDCMILGLTEIDIAERLGISRSTVEKRLKNARKENGMNNIQLVAEYVKRKVREEYEQKGLLDKG